MQYPKRNAKTYTNGYQPCACRDCFELAVGKPGTMCHHCEEAGCEAGERECRAECAYVGAGWEAELP